VPGVGTRLKLYAVDSQTKKSVPNNRVERLDPEMRKSFFESSCNPHVKRMHKQPSCSNAGYAYPR
jgi:hypothetical protein